jgi:hypothetical protein
MTVQVTVRYRADKYDGGNAAAIVAAMQATLIADNGVVMTVEVTGGITYNLNVNDWVVYTINGGTTVINVLPTPEFMNFYAEFVEPGGIDSVTFTQAYGSVSVPASLLGQTQNYDVSLSEAMPSADYVPIASLRGAPNILQGHSILSVTPLDVDTVRVQVQSGAASLAGATIHVTAFSVLVE